MSYRSALAVAIRARAIADATLTGYLAAGNLSVRQVFAGEDAVFPYIYFALTGSTNDEAFRTEGRIQRVDWHVYVPEQAPAASGVDQFLKRNNIVSRLMGDWSAQVAGTGPTYGFNRWQPTVTGWAPTHMEFLSDTDLDEPGVLHSLLQFQVHMTKAGA